MARNSFWRRHDVLNVMAYRATTSVSIYHRKEGLVTGISGTRYDNGIDDKLKENEKDDVMI